jgi:parvulin-like peptidyl-prolyl isomerase
MAIGEVSDVVESKTGFHILRVTKTVAADDAQTAARRAEAEDLVMADKMKELFEPWLNELRGKASIVIR